MYLVFDIGGTKLRLGAGDGQSVEQVKIIETPKIYTEAMAAFKDYVDSLPEKPTAGAGDLKGVLDKNKSMLISPEEHTSFPDWREKPLKKDLQDLVGGPVFLENDAALVGLGEAAFGAGKGNDIVAYITVSTGVGGARIVDGVIDKNAFGFEPGNQILLYDLKKSTAITADSYISGGAIERRMGKKAQDIDDPDFWDEIEHLLAVVLNNSIVHWSPNIFVLGGSVMRSIDIEKVRAYLREILTVYPTLPEIEKATLGDEGGLYGALAYLKQKSL